MARSQLRIFSLFVMPRRARTETVSRVLGTGFNGLQRRWVWGVRQENCGTSLYWTKEVELGNSPPQWVRLYIQKDNRQLREKENNRLNNGDWGQKDWETMDVRTMGKMGTVITATRNKTRKEKETTRIVTLFSRVNFVLSWTCNKGRQAARRFLIWFFWR